MPGESTNFDAQLHALTDEERRAEAIRARQRRGDRRLVAAISGTFAGTLTELAETGAVVTVLTRNGSTIRGRISSVGRDIVIVQISETTRAIVRHIAIEGLRETGAGHNRHVESITDGPELAHLLDELTDKHSRLAFTLSTGNQIMGTVDRVGVDQVVLTLDGDGESMTVPLAAIDHVVVSS